jgi:hypothetical protein
MYSRTADVERRCTRGCKVDVKMRMRSAVLGPQAGQCSTNPDYMQQNCRFACGVCRSPTETPDMPRGNATQNGTVPAWCQFVPTPFQSVACRGSGPGCQCKDWCSSTSVASREWNPECCGCSADLPFSPGSGDGGRCADEDAQCSAWAQAGQCSANPDYMQQNCRFACGLCRSPTETPDTPARHSTQQGRVPAWCQFVPTPFQSMACGGSN